MVSFEGLPGCVLNQEVELIGRIHHQTSWICQAKEIPLVIMGKYVQKPTEGGNLGFLIDDFKRGGEPVMWVVLGWLYTMVRLKSISRSNMGG